MQKPKLKINESINNGKFHFQENFQIQQPKVNKSIVSEGKLTEGKNDKQKLILRPRIEAIHAGRTRNGNIYPNEKLKGDFKLRSGVYSFTYPYPKPLLKNHDTHSEPTGRIKNAQFVSDSLTGKDCIVIIPEVTDQDTIEKVLDGRYLTVSIGATTNSARCNICGTDIISEGWCGHERGETYDGVECGWIVGDIWFDECSWVTVPSDPDAMITSTGEATVMEAYAEVEGRYYNLSADDGNIVVKESLAASLGLTGADDNIQKGGSSQMNKNTVAVEEFNQLKESHAALEAQITEKDTLISEKDGEIATKTTELAEKETALQEKTQEVETLTEKVNTLTEANAELKEKADNADELQGQLTSVTEENTELRTQIHKSLAERVVDLKVALNKITVESREEALEDHVGRTKESLEDSLNDLAKEFNGIRDNLANTAGMIKNPGAGARPGEPGSTIEGNDDPNILTEETIENVLRSLFSGNIKNIK